MFLTLASQTIPATTPQSVGAVDLSSREHDASKTMFSTTAPDARPPKSPHAAPAVALVHTILKFLIEWPCPSKYPVNGCPDIHVSLLLAHSNVDAPIGVHDVTDDISISPRRTTFPSAFIHCAMLSPALTAAAKAARSAAVAIPPALANAYIGLARCLAKKTPPFSSNVVTPVL